MSVVVLGCSRLSLETDLTPGGTAVSFGFAAVAAAGTATVPVVALSNLDSLDSGFAMERHLAGGSNLCRAFCRQFVHLCGSEGVRKWLCRWKQPLLHFERSHDYGCAWAIVFPPLAPCSPL
eukprot:2127041-Rhodomonas_salina.1